MSDQGQLIWQISCDESGIGGQRHYAYGSLWMRWQRRGGFAREIEAIRKKHNFPYEIKWNKAHQRGIYPFYADLIDFFFRTNWLAFHCIIVRKGMVDRSFHDNDYDLARRKHFTKMLSNKIGKCIKAHPKRDCSFRVVVDPIASRYEKADEAVHIIGNNQIKQDLGKVKAIESFVTRDSKESEQIQLCDLLLGAVFNVWETPEMDGQRLRVRKLIASYIGWDDLPYDTSPKERKFNIWNFHDPRNPDREATTKPVRLKHPLP